VAEDATAATGDKGDSVTTGCVANVVETAPTEDVEDCTAAERLADEGEAVMTEIVLAPVP
jgi:hypothetical protein